MIERQAAPLRVQAVELLREEIVRGRFQPGERLKERPLVEELRVSRTVVREALRQLESERLIRMESNVGPVVTAISADDARQLYEVRAALESAAAGFAAERRTENELASLRGALTEIARATTPMERLLSAKQEFYRALITASHNDIIGEQLAGVQARISQLRRLTLAQPGRGERMLAELHAVVEAIARGDRDEAIRASTIHVRTAAKLADDHFQGKQ